MAQFDLTPVEMAFCPDINDIRGMPNERIDGRIYADITSKNVELIPGKWLVEADDQLTGVLEEAAIDTYLNGPNQDTLKLAGALLITRCELARRTVAYQDSFDKRTWLSENWREIARRIDHQLFTVHTEITDPSHNDLGSAQTLEEYFGKTVLK